VVILVQEEQKRARHRPEIGATSLTAQQCFAPKIEGGYQSPYQPATAPADR
jgi:hypothetical protein